MSDPQERPRVDVDNAFGFVGRLDDLYFVAKYSFAGLLIASILYGTRTRHPIQTPVQPCLFGLF